MAAVRPQILVIDDEPQIHRFLSPALDAAGYEPRRADSGQEGLRGIALWNPDAVVLDLGLPDMDGKDVLARAREFYAGPIIVLSARDREAEKIAALDLGAHDYVEKPFGVGELLARLRANLRQTVSRPEATGPLTAGEVIIDLERRLITRAAAAVRLTPKEYDVLAHLARNAGKVVGHRDLLTAVWGKAHAEDTQYLRVVVGQLRQKLEADPAQPRLIATEPGVGYRLSV
ncbi:winged helix-turn-helix domain-containing protein [Brevundimonas sp. 3P9-tot-E]|jgi:two-component system KDP operon response regulator KdpE|uniref:winged helix-turn-helix domain-containing protein n=1 Tax=Brevundimonas TaxID=41275 RepID=UPI000F7B2EC6|nr:MULTISPECIES: winged helix-turn-helix domain-containing protein [Brevundimonas]MDA0743239.1 winged helix-turn-helix domain-containing protein [Pseudomonadota bacterium]MBK1968768.1 winged helix-turn-helix domain-containing protein [Brevundimonas diminuta]MBK1975736.1 winged helix-turn-helix domain-containing protein [Brevundimonas diminuta]MDA1320779.1 winged helix-turn-helix domain-containing protein [Pseudomonadota bacterium]MDM8353049.1 winged helix-turn-helix domain-containing protein [